MHDQTHYDTLGVRADATAAEIRAAYLRRARELHPDVRPTDSVSRSVQREPTMAELNRAYQVLGRDITRREYDRSLTVASTATNAEAPFTRPGGERDDPDVDQPPSPGARAMARVLTPSGPARMPWKLMAVAALIGTIAILITAALADPPSEESPDGILRVGSCVVIEPNGDAREVACTGVDDLVVARLLVTGADCPAAYATHRDRLGLGTVCVELPA